MKKKKVYHCTKFDEKSLEVLDKTCSFENKAIEGKSCIMFLYLEKCNFKNHSESSLILFRMCLFRAAHREGGKKASLCKICHTYHTMIKLGTVITYLKKIQKTYKSCDIPLADIIISSLEISNACYIKKYRYRLHSYINFLISKIGQQNWPL